MKTKKIAVLTLLSFLFITSTLMAAPVNACPDPTATDCTLAVFNEAGKLKSNFGFGEAINVTWSADGIVDIDIHQGTETGPVITYLHGADPEGSEKFDLGPGKYWIVATGAVGLQVNVDTVFVAPESVLGALSAVGACFLAVGTVAMVKRKRA